MTAIRTAPTDVLRLAVLSDVHGNPWALEAVIADARRCSPDQWVLLGDHLADGPDPVHALALLRSLRGATFVRGNTDRYLADLARVAPPRSEMPDLIATWRWAVERLGDEGHGFLSALPAEAEIDTPAGLVRAVHGLPGDDEGILLPSQPGTWRGLDGQGARLLLAGHTHAPYVLHTAAFTVVNPGSVGLPEPTGWRACYALLDLYPGGEVAVEHVQVVWDTAAYVAAFAGGIPLNRKVVPMLEALRRP